MIAALMMTKNVAAAVVVVVVATVTTTDSCCDFRRAGRSSVGGSVAGAGTRRARFCAYLRRCSSRGLRRVRCGPGRVCRWVWEEDDVGARRVKRQGGLRPKTELRLVSRYHRRRRGDGQNTVARTKETELLDVIIYLFKSRFVGVRGVAFECNEMRLRWWNYHGRGE
jgi:hypothetical protein